MVLKIRQIKTRDWKDLKEIYNGWRTENTYSVLETILSDKQAKKRASQLTGDGIKLVIK